MSSIKPKTFIIAEAGSNHNNSLDIGKSMIAKAAQAGCHAVKFQLFRSNTLYNSNVPDFAGYVNINELMKSLELTYEHAIEYMKCCDDYDIEFMVTPFDEETLKFVVGMGVKRIKIAGFEASDPRFVKMCAQTGLPLIISIGNGMSLEDAIELEDKLYWEWKANIDVTFLHCNNAYPTPFNESCLGTIGQYKKRLSFAQVGYSDHTTEIFTPAFAVMTGATVIEKHFTLNKNLQGPDHAFAVEPKELNEMVSLIKRAEESLKVKPWGGTESEKKFETARRSVVCKKDIKAGEILTEENITTARPWLKNTIPASFYYDILGRKVKTSYKIGEHLIKENLYD